MHWGEWPTFKCKLYFCGFPQKSWCVGKIPQEALNLFFVLCWPQRQELVMVPAGPAGRGGWEDYAEGLDQTTFFLPFFWGLLMPCLAGSRTWAFPLALHRSPLPGWEHLLHSPGAQMGEQSQEQHCSLLLGLSNCAVTSAWKGLWIPANDAGNVPIPTGMSCGLCSPASLQKGEQGASSLQALQTMGYSLKESKKNDSLIFSMKTISFVPCFPQAVRGKLACITADVRWCQLVV